jgi:hypothetical protein
MNTDTLIRIAALCVVLAGAETLHGIARTVLVVPRLGKVRATQLSIFTGTALAFGICWVLVPGIGVHGAAAHLLLGGVLALFMASFDIALGMLLLHRAWAKALADLNPATGNCLLFGLMALVGMPLLVARLRGLL